MLSLHTWTLIQVKIHANHGWNKHLVRCLDQAIDKLVQNLFFGHDLIKDVRLLLPFPAKKRNYRDSVELGASSCLTTL